MCIGTLTRLIDVSHWGRLWNKIMFYQNSLSCIWTSNDTCIFSLKKKIKKQILLEYLPIKAWEWRAWVTNTN